MAKLAYFSLSFLLLLHGSLAQLDLPLWERLQRQQQHRLRAKTDCRISQLSARTPSYTFRSEAGVSEYWDASSNEFECAGIEFARHVIQPRGLLLPYYANAPQLAYIVQGSGIQGTVIPGCAETYESESGSSFSGRGHIEETTSSRSDHHQKLRRFRQGDILALQQGFTNWVYNDADTPIIAVELLDVANDVNQLDLKYRKFFLAGNPEAVQRQGEKRERGYQGSRRGEEQQKGNLWEGFDRELIAEAFNVEPELISRLQAKEDSRGIIVRAENLRLLVPEYSREEQERHEGGRYINGLEETFCSLKLRQNIDHPSKADIYNPRGGRISTVNSQTLPILSYLRLSAQRGVLYKNALVAPHYSTNAHTAMYVTRGSARIQVVGNNGKLVLDDVVREGQLLVVPQNFVVVKRASEEGFEYVNFKTHENAMNTALAGRLSAFRAMPNEVLMNSFGISREEAKNLKYGREESIVLSPGLRSGKYA